ncbi:MAG TPA: polysaccharide deacetylase family protein [Smithellaceae bacterium]|nr:polysaccharide deacetylase family protein [Smithellaceae bacterium]HRS90060.1 polysaccharide deacetylase family protein [Smithellaceae bacterium]HRV26910.1 polysaccharide deacetylase family protein [Smithellaceae bacterium]
MKRNKEKLSRAEITGIFLLVAAAVVFFISPSAAALIALFYIILCVLGCFFPRTNFLFDVISRGSSGKNFVALTFDDGPSETVTRQVLDLLDKHQAQATFFVSGVGALRYPDIISDIIARGHTLGNHSYSHNPFLMMKSYRTLRREIARTQEILREAGIITLAFRPPVGIVNPKLPRALEELGMFCVIFSRRARDAGNFFVKNISRKILSKIKADDIILLHDVPAGTRQQSELFIQEAGKLLEGIKARGLTIVPLSVLINREIMVKETPCNKFMKQGI